MRLSFDSIEEVKEFVKQLKGTRGGKGDKEDDAPPAAANVPPPIQPPANGTPMQATTFNPQAFVPPAAGAGQGGVAFPAAAATGPAPEIVAWVQKINAKLDASPASRDTPDALKWFQGQCGTALGKDMSNQSMQDIRTTILPQLTAPALEHIAKLMGIQ